jgi:hypothetical protein
MSGKSLLLLILSKRIFFSLTDTTHNKSLPLLIQWLGYKLDHIEIMVQFPKQDESYSFFKTSRPTTRHTQRFLQWVSQALTTGVNLTGHLYLERSWRSKTVEHVPFIFMVCTGTTFTLRFKCAHKRRLIKIVIESCNTNVISCLRNCLQHVQNCSQNVGVFLQKSQNFSACTYTYKKWRLPKIREGDLRKWIQKGKISDNWSLRWERGCCVPQCGASSTQHLQATLSTTPWVRQTAIKTHFNASAQ